MELDDTALEKLSLSTMTTQGIGVFDHVGDEWLVAALNPLREGLCEALEDRLGGRVHLFVAHPEAFDRWMLRIRAALESPPAPPAQPA